jgi:hypothetical protein
VIVPRSVWVKPVRTEAQKQIAIQGRHLLIRVLLPLFKLSILGLLEDSIADTICSAIEKKIVFSG